MKRIKGDLPEAEHQPASSGAQGISLSFARSRHRPAEPGLVCGHHLHPYGQGVCVSGCGDGLVQPPGSGLAFVDRDGDGVLRRGVAGRDGSAWPAGDLQHRPGRAVHQRGFHRRAGEPRRPHQHGRQGPVSRQHLHRAAVAQPEIRVASTTTSVRIRLWATARRAKFSPPRGPVDMWTMLPLRCAPLPR